MFLWSPLSISALHSQHSHRYLRVAMFFLPAFCHAPVIEESSAAYSCTRHRLAFALSAVWGKKMFWDAPQWRLTEKHPYLNFHCWSVDGSDSMGINKQCLLKSTLFTFLHSACSLNPFATRCNGYIHFSVFASPLTLIQFHFSSGCFGAGFQCCLTLDSHFVNLRNFQNEDSIWSRVVLEFSAAPGSLSCLP